MILSDNETNIDMLNNRAIAKTVAELIRESQERPVSIGVHGDWGAGKSSILAMIEDELTDKDDGVVCIRFNGWKHQGFEDAKIALMSAIVSELAEKRKFGEKAKDTLRKLWKNINWINIAKTAGSVAFSATTGLPPVKLLTTVLEQLKNSVSDKEKISETIGNMGEYLNDAKIFEDTSLAREFSEFQASFEALLQESEIKKLVVLIDDLDRCLPKVTIETLEAVRLFMFSKSTAFVIAADEAMIEYAVQNHFPAFDKEGIDMVSSEYSKRYLEKLIQIPFRIPALGKVESGMYTTLLLVESVLSEESKEFETILKATIEKMKRPWENPGFTIEELKEALGEMLTQVSSEINVSAQISDILAKNTYGNPRNIKRFINMLLLRDKIAKARGFGDAIQIAVLAKIMLAEYYFKDQYKEIAATMDDDGKCSQLHELELHLKQQEEPTKSLNDIPDSDEIKNKNTSDAKTQDQKSKELESWKNNKDFSSWARNKPLLGEIDLRPYYFVSKGKEDFFSEQTTPDQLRRLIKKLLGDSMNIATVKTEISALSQSDAKIVFDKLSDIIRTAADLKNLPRGIDGIRSLVALHRELEPRLVGLIETFDPKTIGLWICSGWEESITSSEAKTRLNAYFEKLKKDGPKIIKNALKSLEKRG
jgi:Cdc6-like AAA superfamily ATPase